MGMPMLNHAVSFWQLISPRFVAQDETIQTFSCFDCTNAFMWKQLLNLLENWVLRIFPRDDPRFRQLLLEIIKQRFPHTRGVVWCMSGLFGESGSFRRWFKLIHMAHWNFIWSRLRFHDPLNDGTGQFPGIECCKSGYGNAVTFPLTSTGNMAVHVLFYHKLDGQVHQTFLERWFEYEFVSSSVGVRWDVSGQKHIDPKTPEPNAAEMELSLAGPISSRFEDFQGVCVCVSTCLMIG